MKAIGALALASAFLLSQTFSWQPYEFKPYERYVYEYRELFRGKEHIGSYEIHIEKEGDNFKVSIRGAYRVWEGYISKSFKDAHELSGFVLMKMYFGYPWLIPLGRTVLSRGLIKVLTSEPIDWKLLKECRFGNLRGRMLEVKGGKSALLRVCVSPSASLPIYVYRGTQEGNAFEIKLLEYSEVK